MQKISYIKFENIEKLDTMGENFWWFRWKINLPYFSIVSTCLLDRNHCTQSGNRAIAQHVRSNFLVPLSYPLDTRQSETFLGGSNWNSSRARIDLCPILAVLCRRACLLPSSLYFQLTTTWALATRLGTFWNKRSDISSPEITSYSSLTDLSEVYVTYPSIILPFRCKYAKRSFTR